jgi:hypothetical protein
MPNFLDSRPGPILIASALSSVFWRILPSVDDISALLTTLYLAGRTSF